MNVDLPALGMPSSPTSASTRSSSCSVRCSPSSPGVNWRGARLVLDLKWRLPRPPLPPAATSARAPSLARSAMSSPRVGVGDHGADRHAQHDVLGAAAVLVGAAAVLAALRAMDARVAIVDQRVDVAVGDGIDAAAAAAVAAVGPAARDVLLAPERGDAVAAVAGDDLDRRFVEELHLAFSQIEDEALGVVAAACAAPHGVPCRAASRACRRARPYCTSSAAQSCLGCTSSRTVLMPEK